MSKLNALAAGSSSQPGRGSEPRFETARALHRWLPGHAQIASELVGAFIVLRSHGGMQAVASHPAQAGGEAWALEAASAALSAGRRSFTWCGGSRATRTCAVAHPLPIGDAWNAVAVLVMRCDDPPSAALLERLDASVARLSDAPEPAVSPSLVSVLRLLEAVFAIDDPQRAGAMFESQLAAFLDCGRVTLALRYDGRLVFTDGPAGPLAGDLANTASIRLADATSLAEEALRRGATLLRGRFTTDGGIGAHSGLDSGIEGRRRDSGRGGDSRGDGACSICVVPWFARGEAVGAVVCERSGAEPFTQADVQWMETASRAAAPWFLLKRRRNLPWLRSLRAAARQLVHGGRERGIAWMASPMPPTGLNDGR